MPQFIPISLFKKHFPVDNLLSDEGLNEFKRKVEVDGEKIALEEGYTDRDYKQFLISLNDPTTLILHDWVEQTPSLKGCLSGAKKIKLFHDGARHLEHQLSDNYKAFLSPSLSEQLIKRVGVKLTDQQLQVLFSYVTLLDNDHRTVVEDKLFSVIKKRLLQLKEVAMNTREEQDLVNLAKPLCSEEIMECVNYLSRPSYSKKMAYVDDILSSIRSNACTPRFANWVLKQLEHIELNHEHEYKIQDLRKELKTGKLKVRNHGSGSLPIKWGPIVATLFIILLGSATIYLIVEKPFSEVKDHQFTNNTSFEQFTKEERIKMDSLLKEMDKKRQPDLIEEVDPLFGGTGGPTLSLRRAFKNPLMEEIYENLMLDGNLKENYGIDSCSIFDNLMSFDRYDGVKDLSERKATSEAVIRNESDYDAILYVSENNSTGNVYSMYIAANTTETFFIDKFNTLFVVIGNEYQPFQSPSGALSDEVPSDKFKNHFCDTDVNYKESMNMAYMLTQPKSDKTKFMIMGGKSGYVSLIDIHQVLEEY